MDSDAISNIGGGSRVKAGTNVAILAVKQKMAYEKFKEIVDKLKALGDSSGEAPITPIQEGGQEDVSRNKANREIEEAKGAITDFLVGSSELLPRFGQVIKSLEASPSLGKFSQFWRETDTRAEADEESLAGLLLNEANSPTLMVGNSLALLRRVSVSFRREGGSSNRKPLVALQRIFERLALLIVGAEAIERAEAQLAGGGGALVMLPAVNTTMVELVMTRINRRQARGPLYRSLKAGLPREGLNSISHPPCSGPNWLEEFETHFVNQLFALLLMPDERKIENRNGKIGIARAYLANRSPDWDGSLYFIVDNDILRKEESAYENMLKKLSIDWSEIHFVKMSDDGDLRGEQSRILAGLLDMFRDADRDE